MRQKRHRNLSHGVKPPPRQLKNGDNPKSRHTTSCASGETRRTRRGKGLIYDVARRGQGLFRSNLEKIEKSCRLTGVSDKRFLIASHIKPWRDSDNREKLDRNNGLLLSPHADKLFDNGWISIDNNLIICTTTEIENLMEKWGLDLRQNVGKFNKQQLGYLEYHRETVFRG